VPPPPHPPPRPPGAGRAAACRAGTRFPAHLPPRRAPPRARVPPLAAPRALKRRRWRGAGAGLGRGMCGRGGFWAEGGTAPDGEVAEAGERRAKAAANPALDAGRVPGAGSRARQLTCCAALPVGECSQNAAAFSGSSCKAPAGVQHQFPSPVVRLQLLQPAHARGATHAPGGREYSWRRQKQPSSSGARPPSTGDTADRKAPPPVLSRTTQPSPATPALRSARKRCGRRAGCWASPINPI